MELLAPAGNLDKLKIALQFGADAVYFGLPDFSLRARSNNFTKQDIIKAQTICQKLNKKFYITMNIYAHNVHLPKIIQQLKWLKDNKIKPDGIIIADPGILRLVKKYLPNIGLHLSTQANATNIEAVKFWQEAGVERVVLARETSLDEIREIYKGIPNVELEVFVHGAMCMSYSGRCILSKWMTNRSANLGDCAQPCRWKWKNKKEQQDKSDIEESGLRKELVDDKDRFGMRVEEDQHGTYMFNSYDISLVQYMEDLISAGVVSFKIEGRAKSVYYLAVVVRAYRKIIDAINDEKNTKSEIKNLISEQQAELNKLSNRGYWTGFIVGDEPPHLFDKAYLPVEWEFAGVSRQAQLLKSTKKVKEGLSKCRKVFVHNKLIVGDKVEIITLDKNIKCTVNKISDEEGEVVESAHGGLGKIFDIEFSGDIPSIFLLRKKR